MINLSSPKNDNDRTNKKYVDDLIDSIEDHIIDPLYDKPLYNIDMGSNGPFNVQAVIISTDPDCVKRLNEITLNLKWHSPSTVLSAEGREMFVFGGFNKISGSFSFAKFKLIYPPFGLSFVGVFATNDDTDFGKYIVGQRVDHTRAGTYTFIGAELSGSWGGGGGGIYVRFELTLNMKVSAK